MKTISLIKILSMLFVFSLTSFTGSEPLSELSNMDNCEVSIQSNVLYGFQRKMVNGTAFSSGQYTGNAFSFDKLVKGVMEVCVDPKGGCKLSFEASESKVDNNFSIVVSGLEDVVKALNISTSKIPTNVDDFIKIAKDNGAEISELGNGTTSVRVKDIATNLTTITLLDTNRQVIMGSSVYGNGNQLKAKMIFKYKGLFSEQELHMLSLLVFEHDMGDKSGWMTEALVKY